jgi:hypothetical protein
MERWCVSESRSLLRPPERPIHSRRFAARSPGLPTNTCGTDNPVTPGNSASSPGSPFNSSLTNPGQAGNVYAGNPDTASLANSNSSATVSQYDVACVQLSH